MNERRPRRSAAPKGHAPLLISLLLVGIVFFLILGIKALKNRTPEESTSASNEAQTTTEAQTSTAPQTEISTVETTPATDSTAASAATESATTEPETTVPATTEPASKMTTVDDSYFSDALFIGDSRSDGLCLFSTPGACKHYTGTSMTIFKIMDTTDEAYGFSGLRSLLQGMQFGKIYIMFGINECGADTAYFASEFRKVIEEIRLYQPDALIYIQSICYVTQQRESEAPVFATANIKEKNESIKVLANDVDIFYLEVNDVLNDGTDHLPSEYTGDGVHLKANYYRLWHDYLLEHAVVDEKHPWTPSGEGTSESEGAQVEHP